MEVIQNIQAIIDMVSLGQQKGSLTLDQASMGFMAIQAIKKELETSKKVTEEVLKQTQVLVNLVQVCQRSGAYTLEQAHLIFVSIKTIQESVSKQQEKPKTSDAVKTFETTQVLTEDTSLPTIKE